jgi:hypothetical protein
MSYRRKKQPNKAGLAGVPPGFTEPADRPQAPSLTDPDPEGRWSHPPPLVLFGRANEGRPSERIGSNHVP